MLALYLAPLYILACVYVVRWLILWLGACHGILRRPAARGMVIGIFVLLALALPVGFFLPQGGLRRLVNQIGFYWLGVLAYILMVLVIADLCRLVTKRLKRVDDRFIKSRKTFVTSGAICLTAILAVSLYGVVNARVIRVTPYEVTIDKDGGKLEELNIVLVADMHLGYNIGCAQMEQMVEKINAQEADLVVIAGDIFDNDFDALEDEQRLSEILLGIKSRYGVYACYGNHDIQEPILAGFTFSSDKKKESDPRMDAFLEASGITLLQDEGVLIDDSFYLYGRADLERPGRGIDVRKSAAQITENMDLSRPVIVLDHEPRELLALADAGVDLDLAGHTHDGQMFPGNIVMKFLWENPCGYLKKGEMHNIVTSGVGLFGPNMRVGTRAEICTVRVHFRG